MKWLKKHWLSCLTHLGALTPLVVWSWQYGQGRFFAPVSAIMSRTGYAGLLLLLLTLAITPLRIIFGFTSLLRIRRALGLYTFAYVVLHLLTFAGWDYGFDWDLLRTAIFNQQYVLLGFAAFFLLLLLALTSTTKWQKRLGPRWKELQRLIYLIALLDIAHVMWLRKNIWEPWPYLVVIALLFLIRVPFIQTAIRKTRRKLQNTVKN